MRRAAPLFLSVLIASCAGASPAPPVAPSDPNIPPMPKPVAAAPRPEPPRHNGENAAVPIFDDDPQIGAENALVTLVVFVDMECPHCASVHAPIVSLASEVKSVAVVWKHYPLKSHSHARAAAEASQGVFALGGAAAFVSFAQNIMTGRVQPTRKDWLRLAHDVGVKDVNALAEGLDRGRWVPIVERGLALGDKLHLEGVPTVYGNGRKYGDVPNPTLESFVDEERAKAEEAVRGGAARDDIYAVMCERNRK
jgi:protein-disulfide isomerase